ncbi:THAP domain-containing protein 5-like isoform X1 [Hippoglossus hippoglossus]|uniref:THAP domain-containing protein 5-like isoform X1 n=2 Tax=Hippoglossus hippoglossus TaxID=8267 RepID=UPI00148D13DA|nr:THAP domain-containing protein 5-like isoform X1 [Hippoglossus hippoglossus]
MPRYCAVKACRNRGGSSSRQDNRRISFYPFPLQDKPRLQRWVDNMRREEWTPSRHQCLCSEHFTEDCFDIRWGIRYLKNTAVPTVFPSAEGDGEKKVRSPKTRLGTLDADIEPTEFDSALSRKPLILRRTCKNFESKPTNNSVAEHTEMISDLPDTGISCHADLSETQVAACVVPGDSEMPTASCLAVSPCDQTHADAAVTVFCCESLSSFSNGEANVDAAALQAALGQVFSFATVEMVKDKPTSCSLEERGPGEGEHVSIYEHSYCRLDTDEDQLWSKILSLHAKILELDRREESTMAKIHTLETEVGLLKRDGAVFKEKQKVLEDYISSMLL